MVFLCLECYTNVPIQACHALRCGLHVCTPDSVISALHTNTCIQICINKGRHPAHLMMQSPVQGPAMLTNILFYYCWNSMMYCTAIPMNSCTAVLLCSSALFQAGGTTDLPRYQSPPPSAPPPFPVYMGFHSWVPCLALAVQNGCQDSSSVLEGTTHT